MPSLEIYYRCSEKGGKAVGGKSSLMTVRFKMLLAKEFWSYLLHISTLCPIGFSDDIPSWLSAWWEKQAVLSGTSEPLLCYGPLFSPNAQRAMGPETPLPTPLQFQIGIWEFEGFENNLESLNGILFDLFRFARVFFFLSDQSPYALEVRIPPICRPGSPTLNIRLPREADLGKRVLGYRVPFFACFSALSSNSICEKESSPWHWTFQGRGSSPAGDGLAC